MQRLKRKPPSTTDPATAYAQGVVSGRILAGPYVRAACKRHLADLKRLVALGYTWDVAEVLRVIGYFREVLTVEIEESDGSSKAIPFILQPWQCFIVGSIFGWKNPKGLRRFRRAYVEVAKGSGKSPMAAGIGHYMLTATKKLRAEVYSAATDRDQAAILFRDAVAMWERSPELNSRLVASGDKAIWQLTERKSNSYFKPISSEKKGKSGVRPYCALVDEIHEHPDDSVIEMLRAGTKGNQQALVFEITNSGFNRDSVCFHEHTYTIKVCEGVETNEAWFGFICCLDDYDDPFEDEDCWIKANPNLGVSIQLPYIREQVMEAKGMPSKEALVRRLHFCEWTDAAKTVIPRAQWEKCEAELTLEDYFGEPCCLGLDMSWIKDLTALSIVFPTGDSTYDAFVEYWTPLDTVVERGKVDGINYKLFADQGFMFAPEGKVIKLVHVAERIRWLDEHFDIQWFAYDKYRLKDLEAELLDLDLDLPMIEHPQGFRRSAEILFDAKGRELKDAEGKPLVNPLWMPDSFQKFETAIIETRLRITINPVTRYCVSSLAARDDPAGTGNRVFDKRKATGRIDGAVALGMGIGAAAFKKPPKKKSIYELMAAATKAAQEDDTNTVTTIAQLGDPRLAELQKRMDMGQFGGDEDSDY